MHLLVLHALGLRLRAPPPRCQAAAAASTEDPVVVIGSGIGGLSCAAMLARYGRHVTVLESHVHAGGCAHSFERRTKEGTFVFDSGPSLWSGMSSPSVNPLRQVLDVVDESDNIDWIAYNGWGMIIPEGEFFFKVGDEESWLQTLREFGGPDAEAQWARLRGACDPVTAASGATPPMVLRSDPWVALSVLRCFGGIMQAAPHAAKLNGPFSLVMEQAALSDPFIRGWLDYLAFALSGLDAAGTLGAAVAFTMGDLYRRGATLDYPVGGAGAVIDALVRGIEKHDGCSVRLGAHVERIELDADGRASGVVLRGGERLGASAVVSNADAWATLRLLPEAARPAERPGGGGALNAALEKTPSFMHLHLGFRGGDGAGEEPLPDGLGIHYSVVLDSFSDICRDNNMVIISIPTLLDPSLAPDGHHVLHAYYALSSLPPLAPRILRRRRPPAHSGVPPPSLCRCSTPTTRPTSRTRCGPASTANRTSTRRSKSSAPSRCGRRSRRSSPTFGRGWSSRWWRARSRTSATCAAPPARTGRRSSPRRRARPSRTPRRRCQASSTAATAASRASACRRPPRAA